MFFQKTKPTRLMVFSDLHYMGKEDYETIRRLPDCKPDAVILLGDITRNDAEYIAQNAEKGGFPAFAICGNHDVRGQYDGLKGVEILDAAAACVNGLVIGGVCCAVRYNDSPDRCMRTQDEFDRVFAGMPRTDILLTHDGPYHMFSENRTHEGIRALSPYIAAKKPKLCLFGHQHVSEEKKVGRTKLLCVYRCAIVDIKGRRIRKTDVF